MSSIPKKIPIHNISTIRLLLNTLVISTTKWHISRTRHVYRGSRPSDSVTWSIWLWPSARTEWLLPTSMKKWSISVWNPKNVPTYPHSASSTETSCMYRLAMLQSLAFEIKTSVSVQIHRTCRSSRTCTQGGARRGWPTPKSIWCCFPMCQKHIYNEQFLLMGGGFVYPNCAGRTVYTGSRRQTRACKEITPSAPSDSLGTMSRLIGSDLFQSNDPKNATLGLPQLIPCWKHAYIFGYIYC